VQDHMCGAYEAALDDRVATLAESPPLEGVAAVLAQEGLDLEWG